MTKERTRKTFVFFHKVMLSRIEVQAYNSFTAWLVLLQLINKQTDDLIEDVATLEELYVQVPLHANLAVTKFTFIHPYLASEVEVYHFSLDSARQYLDNVYNIQCNTLMFNLVSFTKGYNHNDLERNYIK